MNELPDDARRICARLLGAPHAWLLALPAGEVLDLVRRRFADARVVDVLGPMPLGCPDLRALGAQARQQGWALVADDTVPGPTGCAAVRLGSHLAVAPVEEDVCVVGVSRDVQNYLPQAREMLEGLPAAVPMGEQVLRDALDRQRDTWRASSDAAQVVASYLRCHPRVVAIRYPGLRTDPSFEVAARTLTGGFGPIVDVRLGAEATWRRIVCDPSDPREQVMALEGILAGA